jgi:hypothetical protein
VLSLLVLLRFTKSLANRHCALLVCGLLSSFTNYVSLLFTAIRCYSLSLAATHCYWLLLTASHHSLLPIATHCHLLTATASVHDW